MLMPQPRRLGIQSVAPSRRGRGKAGNWIGPACFSNYTREARISRDVGASTLVWARRSPLFSTRSSTANRPAFTGGLDGSIRVKGWRRALSAGDWTWELSAGERLGAIPRGSFGGFGINRLKRGHCCGWRLRGTLGISRRGTPRFECQKTRRLCLTMGLEWLHCGAD